MGCSPNVSRRANGGTAERQPQYQHRADRVVRLSPKGDGRRAAQDKQTPEIFLPNNAPPRLTEADESRHPAFGRFRGAGEVDPDELGQNYATAAKAAGGEPEPRLIYGLLLMRNAKTAKDAKRQSNTSRPSSPRCTTVCCPMRRWVLALARSKPGTTPRSMNELTAMVAKIAKSPTDDAEYSWRGQVPFRLVRQA